jgi:very-short-patch-repair endonuclease
MDSTNHSRLHLGSISSTFGKAKNLRKTTTEAGKLLWNSLRNKRLNGFKFRRQHPLLRYIADFYCHEAKLIVEVDGEIHNNVIVLEYDAGRSHELKELDIKVIRFTNDEILKSIDSVLQQINNEIEQSINEPKGK